MEIIPSWFIQNIRGYEDNSNIWVYTVNVSEQNDFIENEEANADFVPQIGCNHCSWKEEASGRVDVYNHFIHFHPEVLSLMVLKDEV